MRKITGILLCLSLISCEHISAPQENQQIRPIQLRQDIYPVPDSLFAVENSTHVNMGWVTIHLNDSSILHINVPDSGIFTARLTNVPVLCNINSYPLGYDTATWVPIDMHTGVHATWTTNVVVVDRSESD